MINIADDIPECADGIELSQIDKLDSVAIAEKIIEDEYSIKTTDDKSEEAYFGESNIFRTKMVAHIKLMRARIDTLINKTPSIKNSELMTKIQPLTDEWSKIICENLNIEKMYNRLC